jgi:hypothetical protein
MADLALTILVAFAVSAAVGIFVLLMGRFLFWLNDKLGAMMHHLHHAQRRR